MKKSNFIKASSILLIGEILTRFIGLISLGILERLDTNIGIISSILMQPYSFFLVFALLGVSNVLISRLSKSYDNPTLYKKNFMDGLFYVLISGIIVTLILNLFSKTIITTSMYNASAVEINAMINSLRILSISILFYTTNMLLKSLLFSQSKYNIVSYTYISEQIIKTALLVIGSYYIIYISDLPTYLISYVVALSTLFSVISTTLIMSFYAYKKHIFVPLYGIQYTFKFKSIISLLALSGVYFINGLFVTGFLQIDLLSIMRDLQTKSNLSFESAAYVSSIYSSWVWKLISLAISLGSVFITMMIRFSTDKKDNSDNFNTVFIIILLYSLICSSLLIMVGDYFLSWFYSSYSPIMYYILIAQSFLIPLYLLRIQSSVYLISENNNNAIFISTFILFILKISLNPILFNYFNIFGYIISSIISLLISFIFLFKLGWSSFKFDKQIFKQSITIIVKTIFIFTFTFFISNINSNFNNELISPFIKLIILSIVYLSLYLLFLHKDIKQVIK